MVAVKRYRGGGGRAIVTQTRNSKRRREGGKGEEEEGEARGKDGLLRMAKRAMTVSA